MEEYRAFERSGTKLLYEQKFRKLLRENSHALDTLLKSVDALAEEGVSVTNDDFEIECIDINQENVLYSKSFRIHVDGTDFFLKVEKASVVKEGGFEEIESTLLAKKELESAIGKGVRVVQSYWGYENKEKQQSYFVAEWLDLPILENVLTAFNDTNPEKASELLGRLKHVQEVLEGYREVSPANMFYDEEKDEIVLFDLHV